MFNSIVAAARRKIGKGPEWKWCHMEVLEPEGYLVELGIPKTYRSGKNKGRDDWRGVKCVRCYVSPKEEHEECLLYELETGNCYNCEGTGESIVQVSIRRGDTEKRPCCLCGGTGKRRE